MSPKVWKNCSKVWIPGQGGNSRIWRIEICQPTPTSALARLSVHLRSIFAAVAKGTDWESVYNEENDKQSVLATVDEAVAWANELIGRIDEAE